MTQWQTLHTPPAMAGLYARAALRRRNQLEHPLLPDIGLRCVLVIDPIRLGAYRRICGFDNDGLLPPTYPHVLASGLRLALLTDPAFPFALASLVQVGERLRLFRPLGGIERVSASVYVQHLQPHESGALFTLVTRLHDALGPLWEEESDLLCRTDHVEGEAAVAPIDTQLPVSELARWQASADIGRQYARVAGDYNPIHLSRPSARLFGLNQAIAPGMWGLARSMAGLHQHIPVGGVCVDTTFLKPVPLPSELILRGSVASEQGHFSLAGRDGSVHLAGRWAPL